MEFDDELAARITAQAQTLSALANYVRDFSRVISGQVEQIEARLSKLEKVLSDRTDYLIGFAHGISSRVDDLERRIAAIEARAPPDWRKSLN